MEKKVEGLEKLKGLCTRGAALWFRATPIVLEAVGVGAVISAILVKNPSFREKLSELDGKLFMFRARDIEKEFYLYIKDRDIKVLLHAARKPDVVMTGDVAVLFGVFMGREDPDTVFFSRRLQIEGDTAAAIHLKNILASL